jgi:outer membrane protein assembly factor BamE (lipoprotein component of BamABCDE complex)
VKSRQTTSSSLAEQFEKIKVGMTEKEVIEIMGEPKHKEGNIWTYALDRAPAPGEQLMIYQITFRDHRVVRKQIIGGPDATGPGITL